LEALSAAGVREGIDRPALETAIETAVKTAMEPAVAGANRTAITCVAARGLPPIAPRGTLLTWLVDMNDWEKPPAITRDAPLADLAEGGPKGRAGWDVAGRPRDAKQGEKETVTWDETVRAEDTPEGKRLFAARDGEITFDGYTIQIASLREIDGDFGPDTGPLNFTGEIRITGDVLPGAALTAGRGILVGGSSGGALLSSGGVVTVLRGIRGMEKGIVRSRLAIEAPFAEEAALLAVADILIKDRISNCAIKTNGKVILQGETARIEGGLCRTKLGLDTFDAGNEQGSKTEISFGQDYLIKDQLDQIQREIVRLTDNPSPGSNRQSRQLTELKARELGLKAKFGAFYPAEIRVRGTLWPGVVMESHGKYYEVKRPMTRVLFQYDRETGRIRGKALE
jgi:hypothetical protein